MHPKHRLIESKYLKGIFADTGKSVSEEMYGVSNYLFCTNSSLAEFVIIEEEIDDLNNFCTLSLNHLKDNIEDRESHVQDFEGRTPEEIGDNIDIAHMEISNLEYMKETFMPGMCLMLTMAFVEKSLKYLCKTTDEAEKVNISSYSGSHIQKYIEYLKDRRGLYFETPSEVKELISRYRKLRNQFAHGDWITFEKGVSEICLQNVFSSISLLFTEIENAYVEAVD